MGMIGDEKRSERVDMRLTLTEKRFIEEYAKRHRRTLTSLFVEWIEILAKDKEND